MIVTQSTCALATGFCRIASLLNLRCYPEVLGRGGEVRLLREIRLRSFGAVDGLYHATGNPNALQAFGQGTSVGWT